MNTTKVCPACKLELDVDNFCKTKAGLNAYCRKCASKKVIECQRNRRKNDPMSWYPNSSYTSVSQRATNGKYANAPSVLANQQQNSYHKKNIQLLISKEEWFDFWKSQEELVLKIIETGDIPSIDRVDSNKDYTLDNIRILPLSENRRKCKNSNYTPKDRMTTKQRNRMAYEKNHPGARVNNYKGA